jgi:hypothetical protein
MRRNALLLISAAVFFGVAGPVSADAPPPVAPHQHFLVLPDDTQLPVGPDICANPEADQGFFGFHQNIHTGTPNLSAFQEPNNPVGFTAIFGC